VEERTEERKAGVEEKGLATLALQVLSPTAKQDGLRPKGYAKK